MDVATVHYGDFNTAMATISDVINGNGANAVSWQFHGYCSQGSVRKRAGYTSMLVLPLPLPLLLLLQLAQGLAWDDDNTSGNYTGMIIV